ncbi:hypothetical protein VNO77_04608 [Canavalia gladiata]|uniref:Uncharacterized protein n=1 Tax=Canavalia gladiata TaxID=3824 RepID=A0AAN9RDD0_CANGL
MCGVIFGENNLFVIYCSLGFSSRGVGVADSMVGVGASPAFSKSSLSEVGLRYSIGATADVGLNTGVGGAGDDMDSLYISCRLVLLATFLDRKYLLLPTIVVPYKSGVF